MFNIEGYNLTILYNEVGDKCILIYKDISKPVYYSAYYSANNRMYFDVELYKFLICAWTPEQSNIHKIGGFNKMDPELENACLIYQFECLKTKYDAHSRMLEIYEELLYKKLFGII